jgi:hypothetical protein
VIINNNERTERTMKTKKTVTREASINTQAKKYASTMGAAAIAADALREIKWLRSCNGYAECEPQFWLDERIAKIEAALLALGYRSSYVVPTTIDAPTTTCAKHDTEFDAGEFCAECACESQYGNKKNGAS